MVFELILFFIGVLLMVALFRSHRQQKTALGRRDAVRPLRRYPSVTVVRPIKGLDAGAQQNLDAALDHGYPGPVQTLFVFDDRDEPAVPLVERTLARARTDGRQVDARIVYSGQPPRGRTGKLNAMIAGLRRAKGELVAFADSDIRPDRQALTRLVETLMARRDNGSAFAPVVVTEPATTTGDVGYAMLLNGLYGPAAAHATVRGGGELPFIMGQFMVFRREVLTKIGGLETADGQLVDDMYLGLRVKQVGYRNTVSSHAVPVIQQGMTAGEFARTFLRWIAFSRSGLPGREFKLASWVRGAIFWVGLVAAGVALSQGFWLAAALNVLAPLGIAASMNHLHRALGGAPLSWRHFGVGFVVLLVAPLVYFQVLTRRSVTWRGRSYELNGQAQLAARPLEQPLHRAA